MPWFLDKLNEKLEVAIPYPFKKSTQMGQDLRQLYFGNDPTISFDEHCAELYKVDLSFRRLIFCQ